jgi:catechol 2,3-dioxygenase-like lactoylglutathione lyase family enzyme
MKMTIDFYVGVLGMRLVHAMKVPPGVGTGPGNRGNPPFEEIRHYFFDMGRDGDDEAWLKWATDGLPS